MATIIHASASSEMDVSSDFDVVDGIVTNYWGTIFEEKIYPIPFWKMFQLFNASPSEQVALHVTDFDNRALVDAEWMSYNEALEPLLAGSSLPSEYYFVMHESLFQKIRGIIPVLENPINQLMMWGRLGKTTNGNFTAFLMAAKGTIVNLTGGGGDGLTTGVRIPPEV